MQKKHALLTEVNSNTEVVLCGFDSYVFQMLLIDSFLKNKISDCNLHVCVLLDGYFT